MSLYKFIALTYVVDGIVRIPLEFRFYIHSGLGSARKDLPRFHPIFERNRSYNRTLSVYSDELHRLQLAILEAVVCYWAWTGQIRSYAK